MQRLNLKRKTSKHWKSGQFHCFVYWTKNIKFLQFNL